MSHLYNSLLRNGVNPKDIEKTVKTLTNLAEIFQKPQPKAKHPPS
jgi:hypothetical protein